MLVALILQVLVGMMDQESVKSEYAGLLKAFEREEVDSIRLHAVQNAITIAKQLGTELGRIRTFFFCMRLVSVSFLEFFFSRAQHYLQIDIGALDSLVRSTLLKLQLF
jgi:hypothetical protein